VKSQVEDSVSEGKLLISKTKDRYTTTQQLVPTDIGQEVSSVYSFSLNHSYFQFQLHEEGMHLLT